MRRRLIYTSLGGFEHQPSAANGLITRTHPAEERPGEAAHNERRQRCVLDSGQGGEGDLAEVVGAAGRFLEDLEVELDVVLGVGGRSAMVDE
jgi:hypothetical protein